MIEPTEEELLREYSNYKTEDVQAIYDRFKAVSAQARKRVRAAQRVLVFRMRDNHQEPPEQIIRPKVLGFGMHTRQ